MAWDTILTSDLAEILGDSAGPPEELEYDPGAGDPVRLNGIWLETQAPDGAVVSRIRADRAAALVARADLAAPERRRTVTRDPDGTPVVWMIEDYRRTGEGWRLELAHTARPVPG